MPKNVLIKKQILKEAHNSRYSVHTGGNKIYIDETQYILWNDMKIEITEYIDNRLTCQKVEAQQQHLVSELRPSDIPT